MAFVTTPVARLGLLLSRAVAGQRGPKSQSSCRRHSGVVGLRAQSEGEDPPKPTLEEVKALVSSEDLGDRARGVNKARYLEPADCLDILLVSVKDVNSQVRYAAVSQLAEAGRSDPQRTFPVVTELLVGDAESSVRAGAADVITTLKMPESFDILAEVYNESTDWMLKFSIVSGLGELADERCYDLLVDALAADEPLLQMAALGALGELGDVRAIELVKPYVDSEDSAVQDRAKIAMSQLRAEV